MRGSLAPLAAWSWILFLVVGAVALVGCTDDLPLKSAGEYCQNDSQCRDPLICLSRTCREPPSGEIRPREDAGPEPDAGFDAGMDAGSDEDAGSDAGSGDDGGADAAAGGDAGADAAAGDDAGGDAG